jgi:hypothetical protein
LAATIPAVKAKARENFLRLSEVLRSA